MMNIVVTGAMWKFLAAHQIAATAAFTASASWVVSAYASTLDQPPPNAPRLRRFWYQLVHTAAANLDRLRGLR